MPYFETADTVRLFHRDWGSGDPVVFLSSWSLSSAMWQYQMVDLVRRGLRCLAYDRRSHGRSDDPGRGYDYDTLADDLAAFLETLDLDDVTLVGHSMAGGEIVRYLTRHGHDRIRRIALVSPIAPFPMRTDDNPDGIDPAAMAAVWATWEHDITAWVDASADAYVGRGLPGCDVSPGIVEWTKRDLLQTPLHAQIECQRTGMTTDLRAEMTKISRPTLIIHGDCDATMPASLSARVCADLVSGSELVLYEHAPHALYLTHRGRLDDDLAAFIAA